MARTRQPDRPDPDIAPALHAEQPTKVTAPPRSFDAANLSSLDRSRFSFSTRRASQRLATRANLRARLHGRLTRAAAIERNTTPAIPSASDCASIKHVSA